MFTLFNRKLSNQVFIRGYILKIKFCVSNYKRAVNDYKYVTTTAMAKNVLGIVVLEGKITPLNPTIWIAASVAVFWMTSSSLVSAIL
jgi:hypothetical protein